MRCIAGHILIAPIAEPSLHCLILSNHITTDMTIHGCNPTCHTCTTCTVHKTRHHRTSKVPLSATPVFTPLSPARASSQIARPPVLQHARPLPLSFAPLDLPAPAPCNNRGRPATAARCSPGRIRAPCKYHQATTVTQPRATCQPWLWTTSTAPRQIRSLCSSRDWREEHARFMYLQTRMWMTYAA